ncbi:ligand-binding sensor domain-containing protein/DNA-binding CsgD family transcriptional regulator [Pedobacter cryoconitis]|uniref:Ligand-binding sensor domain-containing protein/DNA-binding CsgD family transcriptional regulator n=1 Tax=Pedobacter cryoconitis TaxID=188932 RepID=A0A7W9E073_9SPHI|nr:triple tyrosine motif-containing protein [Pedobacter cryoconitis]MBB5636325.1 ligand-binding sensor domain-containing protein/DNA-binding CsgD family transcriptional regulator [Pedobacter cryoconitis]
MKIRYLLNYLLFLCFILTGTLLKASQIKSIGVPYVQNFPKSVYLSGNQNWAIAKDRQGIMYFGNTQGLLTYDGKYWQQYQLPNRQIVRSVAAGNNGMIYTGAFGEFGYWSTQNKKLTYTSLVKLIPGKGQLTDEVWKIIVDGKRIIFQSFTTIYSYENNKITKIKGPGSFLFLHHVGSRFLVEVLDKGIFELKGHNLIPLPHTDLTVPKNIMTILPYKNGSMLIGTSKDGLFIYNGSTFTPFNIPANDFLKTFQLNNGSRINDKYYAFGTILNGLILIDQDGNTVQQINKSRGLQNNTVLSVFTDDEQNLWAGLDNGIDRVELNSPLYFYLDKAGQFGTVYSSLIYNNNIYLGTNQGLFYSPWSPGNSKNFNTFDFRLVPNSQGQVWDLSVLDGQLIMGHNVGSFRVTGNQLEKISSSSGGWTIKKLNSNPDYLIQGTYNGLVLYRKDANGQWRYFTKIENFDIPSRYVEQDSRGDIWVSHAYKGLYKLTLSPDFKRVIKKNYYDEKNGLPGNYNINLFTLENKLIFSSDAGFMLYDDISNRFTPYKELNKGLGSFANSNKIISAGVKKYWFINHGKTAMVDFSEPGRLIVDSNRLSLLDGRMVQYYENISPISNSMHLVSVDDGFVIYDAIAGNHPGKKNVLPAVLIRRVEDVTDVYKTISENGNSGGEIEIPFNRNNIRISFALPYYRQAKIKFQYYLEGYANQWSEWSPSSQKDFTNLAKGHYRFLVRAKINDELVSKVSVFEFTVLPPFYASNWAFALYVILIILLFILAKKQYQLRLQKDHEEIVAKVQLEKEIFLKKEAEERERQLNIIQTERLQAELKSKNRELANSAMSLVYKNELLQKLSQEMIKLKDEKGKALADDQFRKIQKVIDEGMNDERDWNLFETSFNEAHGSFFKKLKASHPDLVPNDLKLCAYLHMNMSSKEMASLLNISLRGVEIRRYRLRKKLNIPHDKNLAEFFMEL